MQFQSDTGKWEQVVQREYSWEDDAYRYYRGPSNNLYEISEEEYQQIVDGLTRERIELEWTMLDVS